MTHPLTAAKVDKLATLAQRSAAASRVEMHTDVAGAEARKGADDTYYDRITHTHILWNPEGEVKYYSVVQDGGRLYAKSGGGDWWALSDLNAAGWRVPSVKIKNPNRISAYNAAQNEEATTLVNSALYHGLRTANAELVKAIEGAEGRIGHIADALLQDIRYGDAFISKKGASTSLSRIALELREALTKFGGSA